ncbi:ester cyclase [Prauserella cavernicola]|uniref:Ester cyclase n=1 Tax=Prauserella cavernicola TaxID=2800127 RepID=A0A934QN54_9PSEU|nr:nuclear transport factor 2 family protein [Prauserella cavernicola]MBK1783255.1 ester cyclase [Prauserella cavernicola]
MSYSDKHRASHEAFNRRDWDAVSADFAPDAEYTDVARDTTLKGRAEIVDYLRDGWVGAFSDAAATEEHFHDGPDHSVAEFTGTGTQDGALGPFPQSGKRMALRFCEVLHYNDDGLVTDGSLYYDQASLLAQLGHQPAG